MWIFLYQIVVLWMGVIALLISIAGIIAQIVARDKNAYTVCLYLMAVRRLQLLLMNNLDTEEIITAFSHPILERTSFTESLHACL